MAPIASGLVVNSSPAAFKQALEQRLRAATGGEFTRKRQLLVFDRFLAQIVAALGDAVMLKGGLVLELRLERARTTRYIDLRLLGSPEHILSSLQEAGRLDLGDFMSFEIIPDVEHTLEVRDVLSQIGSTESQIRAVVERL